MLNTILKEKENSHENLEKTILKSSIIYGPIFFQYCQHAQNQPKFQIHENGALRDFYIMTFVVAAL